MGFMSKLTRKLLTPFDAMFIGAPIAYTPGSAKQMTPSKSSPAMAEAISPCQMRAKASLDADAFSTARIVAAQFWLGVVELYGAWRLTGVLEADD